MVRIAETKWQSPALASILIANLVVSVAPLPAIGAPSGLGQMRELAVTLLRNGEYDDAIDAYRVIVKETPDDAQSHYELASALAFLRRYAEAVEPIESAVLLDAADVKKHELAGIIYFHLRWFEKGTAATLRGAELGDVNAMYALIDYYEKGLGVEADPNQAFYWTKRTAESGHLGAMELMERIYRRGLYGENADPHKADKWARKLQDALDAQ